MKKIVLCGRPGKCCPEVLVTDEDVSILDDDGNIVMMNREQFDILKEKIVSGEID